MEFVINVPEYTLKNQIRNRMISEAVQPGIELRIRMVMRYPDMDRSGWCVVVEAGVIGVMFISAGVAQKCN